MYLNLLDHVISYVLKTYRPPVSHYIPHKDIIRLSAEPSSAAEYRSKIGLEFKKSKENRNAAILKFWMEQLEICQEVGNGKGESRFFGSLTTR